MVRVILGTETENTGVIDLKEGMSISSAFRTKGFVTEGRSIRDLAGGEYDGSEKLENGQTYLLTANYKDGQQ